MENHSRIEVLVLTVNLKIQNTVHDKKRKNQMKLTNNRLEQIIKEELDNVLREASEGKIPQGIHGRPSKAIGKSGVEPDRILQFYSVQIRNGEPVMMYQSHSIEEMEEAGKKEKEETGMSNINAALDLYMRSSVPGKFVFGKNMVIKKSKDSGLGGESYFLTKQEMIEVGFREDTAENLLNKYSPE